MSAVPAYAFLSQPPPVSQKKRAALLSRTPTGAPGAALPPTPMKTSHNKEDRIASWACKILPGSPAAASPCRPSVALTPSTASSMAARRRSSFGCALGMRRPSVCQGIAHGRLASGSGPLDHLIKTPSTSQLYDFVPTTADLKAQGYTTVFVHLPSQKLNTTTTSTPESDSSAPFKLAPAPSGKNKKSNDSTKTIARLRSFNILRPSRRARSSSSAAAIQSLPKSPLPAPSSPVKHFYNKPPRTPISPGTAIRRTKHRKAALPPNLTSELLMLQFMGGGKLDSHAPDVIGKGNAVFRDGEGGLWRDCDEPMEYAALVEHQQTLNENDSRRDWITFDSSQRRESAVEDVLAIFDFANDVDMEKRASDASMTTAELMTQQPMIPVEQEHVLPPRRIRNRPPPLKLTPPGFRDPFSQPRRRL